MGRFAGLRGTWVPVALASAALALAAAGCGGDGGGGPDGRPDAADAADGPGDLSGDARDDDAATDPAPGDAPPDVPDAPDGMDAPDAPGPGPDTAARARAFRLYYRERVERALVAYNRFMLFGDTTFGIDIGKAGIAKRDGAFEVVPGPKDNNDIGTSVRATWFAYQVFRSRPVAVSLVRMFRGMRFIATVSGHDGVTGRNAYPNWTLTVDGGAGTVLRTRGGQPVAGPWEPRPEFEAEVLATLFDGVRIRYRSEPADILLNHMPARETGPFAVTYGFSRLPGYLRVSDCCTSLLQVPEPYAWAGAFWSNHNSRDNFPDLAFGYVAAREALDDPGADADVRAAAAEAWDAGLRVGDSVESHGGRIVTVQEDAPYGDLVPSGAVRPDGSVESGDLGSMADCQMRFLARALSSTGLALPLPGLEEPGALDAEIGAYLDPDIGCPEAGTAPTCTRLDQAFCGRSWGQMNDLTLGGTGLLDLARQMEQESPGSAGILLGHFYGNYDQPVNSLLALREWARVTGDAGLAEAAAEALGTMTDLSRTFADLIHGNVDPGEQARARYWTALVDAQGGLPASAFDLGEFAEAEAQMARLEALLDLQDTPDAPLLSDEDIARQVEDELSGKNDIVQKRYRDAWGTTPPVRRAGDGYEARVHTPEGPGEWRPVERPRHVHLGGIELLEALPLCVVAPEILDCTWARLGCARPDLDGSGTVDDADLQRFQQAAAAGSEGCTEAGGWCGGADLDRSGTVDSADLAFLEAAKGCRTGTPGAGRPGPALPPASPRPR